MNLKLISLLSVSLLGWSYSPAQEHKEAKSSFWNKQMLQIAHPESKNGWIKLKEDKQFTKENFFDQNKEALGVQNASTIRLTHTSPDQEQNNHYKYQQSINSIKIEGAEYILHEKNGKITAANGKLYKGKAIETVARYDAKSALRVAIDHLTTERPFLKNHLAETPIKLEDTRKELVISRVDETKGFDESNLVLMHKFVLIDRVVYIDAINGSFVKQENVLQGCNNGLGNTIFYNGRTIGTHKYFSSFLFDKYELRDNCRGNGIETRWLKKTGAGGFYNVATGSSLDVTPKRFRDPNNNFTNVHRDRVGATAHWSAEMTYDYFLNNFQRNSYDNSGAKMEIFTEFHFSQTQLNLPGASTGDFAGYDRINEHFLFGDGGNLSHTDWVSLDVVGHEFTHALIQHTANLNTTGEAGALSEGFCDIFGSMVEHSALGNAGNYFLGEAFINSNSGGMVRNMQNPNAMNHPDTYLGTNWVNGAGATHINNGVLNFWYFLLAEGGSGTNDNSTNFNVQGIGRGDAAAIAYRAITAYLFSSAEFADARDATIWSAEDLFGDCSNQVVQVINAWNAVGVTSGAALNSPDPNFSSPSSVCIGTNFNVSPTVSSGVTHKWWFYPSSGSPGNPISTAVSPTITPNSSGNYSIKHEINSPCGSFSMTKNIVINSIPNVSVSDAVFCNTNSLGDLVYFPNGGTMFGNGTVFNNNTAEWKFNANQVGPGTYTIKYEYTSNAGCKGTDLATVTVDKFFTAQIINFQDEYCQSVGNIPLAGSPLGGTWTGSGVSNPGGNWVFNPFNLSGAVPLQYTYTSPNNVCTSTDNMTMYIDDPISFAPSIPFPQACNNAVECFSANPNNAYSHNPSYNWNFAGGAPPSTDPIHCTQFNNAGNYAISLSGTNKCGTTTQNLSLQVVAPFPNFTITTPDPICGAVSLQTNYTGAAFVSWSGSSVNPYNGNLSNPNSDVTSHTITATIEDACQVTTTKTFTNHYKKKPITPDQFCSYDLPTQLQSDIAPGIWTSTPTTSALTPSNGNFDPSSAAPGTYSITHQSVCNTTEDIVVLPGGPASTQGWAKQIHDLGSGNESGRGIAKAFDGSYYLTGTYNGTIQIGTYSVSSVLNSTDIYIAKYDDCGIVWLKSIGNAGNEAHPEIVIDHGNQNEPIYISGSLSSGITTIPGGCGSCVLNATASRKGFIAKLDADGNGVWATIPANEPGEVNAFKGIDAFGNRVVVTGNFRGNITLSSNNVSAAATGGANDRDIHAISLQDAGQNPTFFQLNTKGSFNNDDGKAISIDLGSQEIFVTGYGTENNMDVDYITQNAGGKDVFIGKLDHNFNWEWSMLLGGTNDDEGNGIDADNYLIVTGIMEGDVELAPGMMDQTNNFSRDAFVLGMHTSAQYNWHYFIGSTANLDRGADVAILDGNQVTAVGEFSGTATVGNGGANPIFSSSNSDRDIYFATFDVSNGSLGIVSPIRGPGSNDVIHTISPNMGSQDYAATGNFDGSIDINISLTASAGRDMFALRYNPLQPNTFFKKKDASLSQGLAQSATNSSFKAYPNPFNNNLIIESAQQLESSIEIIDVTGKSIYRVKDIKAGEFRRELDLSQYASGIYMIRLTSSDHVETLKVMKQ